MPTVLLVRHGQASFGAEDYDVLSAVGVRQSEVLAEAMRRRGVEPTRLITGSMRRQVETAAAFAEYGEATVDERWDEYDPNAVLLHHGETELRLDGPQLEGQEELTSRAFQAVLDPALRAWIEAAEGSLSHPHTWTRFADAGAAALAELRAELERGETALVFTSGGTIAAICAALLDSPESAFPALNRGMVNTGVSKIVIGAAGTSLIGFNDHSHLEEADRSLITYR
ncbi:MAG: histidine phosphatase family protein [Thermoleophilia bacterium]|nr:histidine phosphatase family protein [Thermoleophilia bacterium]